MAGLSAKLKSLVEASQDPNVYLSVLLTLDGGSPMSTGGPDGGFPKRVHHLRMSLMSIPSKWYAKLQQQQLQQQQQLLREKMIPLVLDQKERQLATMLFQQSTLGVFIRHLPIERPEALQEMLRKGTPLIRLLVVCAIGRRHLHYEKDLIECLNAPELSIREASHLALVQCARGTDFGPIPGVSQKSIARSVEKWRHWLALQHGDSPDTTVEGKSTIAGTDGGKVDPAKALKLVLGHADRELQTVSPEVTQLRDELVKARGDEQMSLLARLRDAKGIEHTDALALAIPKLSAGAAQREARDALAQRLTRMTAKTLRDKLQDDSVEVRRAAALACGRKQAVEHIADLLQLLDDPEVAVIQAARQALRDLTGEDFGPDEEAGRRGRSSAATAWRKWCKEHPRETK